MSVDPILDSPIFNALLREAGIAAELLGSGVTALRRANSTQHGLYNLALFNLAIGLERAAKLVIVVDYCIEHTGIFPTDAQLRSFGHNLESLMREVEKVTNKRRSEMHYPDLPNTEIHEAIIETLAEFATATRYYNLDLLVRGKGASRLDPLAAWRLRVGEPILKKHYTKRQRIKDQAQAAFMQGVAGSVVLVRHRSEQGDPINTLQHAMLHGGETAVIQKWGQFYTLQIIRYLNDAIWAVESAAHAGGLDIIPYLHEFFRGFWNDDSYLKSRKTWSGHRL